MGRVAVVGLVLLGAAPLRGDESWFKDAPEPEPEAHGEPSLQDMVAMSQMLED